MDKNLNHDLWTKDHLDEYYNYLISLKGNEKQIKFAENVLNTKLKVLGIPAPKLKEIVKSIYEGNYLSFLDLMPNKYHESLMICAYLISKIKDYKLQMKYINKFTKYIDGWSLVDTLKFSIKKHEDEYFDYALKLIKSSEPSTRRIGVRILFSYTKNKSYLNRIYDVIDSFKDETHYYVNMALAWLLCELFIKSRDETISYYKRAKSNKFVINKSISKCRDSYRVSTEDKELLLKYKIGDV